MKRKHSSKSARVAHPSPQLSPHLSPQSGMQPQSNYGKSIVVIAVALTMLISVIGTFVVLNELSSVERSVDALQAHRALNAMLSKQQPQETTQQTQTIIYKPTESSGQVSIEIL